MVFQFFRSLCLATKLIFQLILLAIFVFFFGIPSVERFISKEVLTVTTKTYPEKILPPAVTIIAFNSSEGGWEALEKACGDAKHVKACLQENTHSLPETVHAEMGLKLRKSLMAPELWRTSAIPGPVAPTPCSTRIPWATTGGPTTLSYMSTTMTV